MYDRLQALFRSVYQREPAAVARAPGRIEFIGNHTDYNGGTVLGAALDRGTWVAVSPRTDGVRRFYSEFSPTVVTLAPGEIGKRSGNSSWVNYPLGVAQALPFFDLKSPIGFDFLAVSDLPAGAGLSSSAALELASALAFLEVTHQSASREVVVKVGRHAENQFVGVPCGILDQGVSGFGQKDRLVFIDCRGPRFETVPLPAGAHFWLFNTHTKHALVDGLYAARHRECMESAAILGVDLLVDATGSQVEAKRVDLGEIRWKRARHVLGEIQRVEEMVACLQKGDLVRAGHLLTASHASSRLLFENSTDELDFLVERLAAMPGVFGARLTGGGFGGAVMALTTGAFGDRQAQEVAAAYAQRFGARVDSLHAQTGDGANVVTPGERSESKSPEQ
ncbi:MAG TPA: galactokinase [Opitutaceae bacterium]|nr:galactokinase [Opitutaceae bacterium]